MPLIRLGQVDYINCIPVYNFLSECIEENQFSLNVQLTKGVPSQLNSKFLSGELDVTPLSSIEYARNCDKCYILPDISISSDGKVGSIFLFSRVPVTELDGKTVAVTSASATSTVLLKILFEHYYHVKVKYMSVNFNLQHIPPAAEALLLIGDDAMQAYYKRIDGSKYVLDLGEVWKHFTGAKMIYALWVVRKDFADNNEIAVGLLSKALLCSKLKGLEQLDVVIEIAKQRTVLPKSYLREYIKTLSYSFDDEYQNSLLLFYDYAYKSGFIDKRVKLNIWRGKCAD
ncbi:menaquinone biosynthesis protein [Peptococcaceae bacterium]|nr:menaquinone biosynthesis protein [Peptococcaceae bacterium]